MKKFIYILWIAIIGGGAFTACNDEESFSTAVSDRLSFSADTVSFDTVFTTIGSSTTILKVYNPNKKALRISSIALADAPHSGFRVNVDGSSGTAFSDVEINSGDSLYVFIELTVDPQNSDNPVFIKDSLTFQTNGNTQYVKLQAYGRDVIILKGKTISEDTTFTSKRPILVYDSLRIDKGATLTIEPGTELYFHSGAWLQVHGTLQAVGNTDQRILFRGDRTDWMFSYLPYDHIPGQWGGIHLYNTSGSNHLSYVNIHSATSGLVCDSTTTITLENSVLHNFTGTALNLQCCTAAITNCQITNAAYNCVTMNGGKATFLQCTLANYYSWSSRYGYALGLSMTSGQPVASFTNCLIDGVSNIDSTAEGKEVTYNSCTKSNTDGYLDINADLFEYDFRLSKTSKAINAGNAEAAAASPLDLNGRNRLADTAPDNGCYEWENGDDGK
jgi:hypothetical protein